MPIYRYKCKYCKYCFEEFTSFEIVVKEFIPCPMCRGYAKKLFESVPIIFKGDGFTKSTKKENE